MIALPSQRILITMFLKCENDLACTATPMDEDAVDDIIASVGVNDGGDCSEGANNFQDTPNKMKRVGFIVKLLYSVARVKRFVMVSNKLQQSPITHLHGIQKALRSQSPQGMVQNSITDFFLVKGATALSQQHVQRTLSATLGCFYVILYTHQIQSCGSKCQQYV